VSNFGTDQFETLPHWVSMTADSGKISKPGLYREFGNEDHLMDAALTRYSETVLGPVLTTLCDDRPFRETLDSLIDFATREEAPDVPSGCLFTKMRSFPWRLALVTGEHNDQLREDAVAAYAARLGRCVNREEIELPAPIEIVATDPGCSVAAMW